MGEERSLAALIAVTLALGLVAAALALWLPTLSFTGGLSVDTYEAEYALNGSLAERYVYNVGAPGTYRMLFRTFDDPLVFNATGTPHMELVGSPAAERRDRVRPRQPRARSGSTARRRPRDGVVRRGAGRAERGGARRHRLLLERHVRARYGFVVRPPVEYDASFVHVNLKLAREGQHVPYSFVRITLPADGVSEVFAYPPTLRQTREGDRIVIRAPPPRTRTSRSSSCWTARPSTRSRASHGRSTTSRGRRGRPISGRPSLHALGGALLGRYRLRAPRARDPPSPVPAVRPREGLHRARVPEHGPRPDQETLGRQPPLHGGRGDLGRGRVLRDRARPAPARA